MKKSVKRVIFAGFIIIIGLLIFNHFTTRPEPAVTKLNEKEENASNQKPEQNPAQKPVGKNESKEPKTNPTIKVSAAGDFTLGTDESFPYQGSFPQEAKSNGLPYFVAKLDNIFQQDDLTTVNLETTFTHATKKTEKTFRFKGDPSYTKILTMGGIESVNLANNHIHDYLEQGYQDTMDNLEKEGIGYFGYENHYVTTIKGIKVGALGYEGWSDTPEVRSLVSQDIEKLREQGVKIILVHFHWGIEKSYVPSESQRNLARYTIDSGADLVLGHHPHVVQGIEEYKGKFIVYSLGNFMFGGNRNTIDKDTFVFQQTFHIQDGELSDKKEIDVVPFSISSVSNRNNYQPVKLTGAEAERVKTKIIDVSNQIGGSDWLQYEK